MQIISEINPLRTQIQQWQHEGQSIALILTKGEIHDGHLALVREAAEHANIVVVSIFVNPLEQDELQLTTEHDIAALRENGVSLVFIPTADEMTQPHIDQHIYVDLPRANHILFDSNGKYYNYFQLFITNTCKLYNLIQPNVVCVGETDLQRLSITQKLIRDLCFPIKLITLPAVREIDGLVASRNNKKLTIDERQRAPVLAKTLRWASGQIRSGRRDFNELVIDCKDQLRAAGLIPDEILIRDAQNFQQPQEKTEKLMIFASVKLSHTNLTDNLVVDITTAPIKQTDDEKNEA